MPILVVELPLTSFTPGILGYCDSIHFPENCPFLDTSNGLQEDTPESPKMLHNIMNTMR